MAIDDAASAALDADRKTVAGGAAEAQGWSLQRVKRVLSTREAEESDVEAPKAPPVDDIESLPYLQLYRGVDALDWLLILVGTIGAIGAGATLPGFTVALGSLLDAFNPEDGAVTDIASEVNRVCLLFVYIGVATMVASYLEVAPWMLTGVRVSNRFRHKYLRSALRQEVAFYDTEATTGVLLQGLNEDTNAIQNATGEKVGAFIHHLATFVGGIAIAFWKGWQLTLVMMSVLPLLAGAGVAFGSLMEKLSSQSSTAYGRSHSIVQQALSNIRTVMAFNGQEATKGKYRASLAAPQNMAIRQGVVNGLTLGILMGIMYGSYGLSLWRRLTITFLLGTQYGSTRIIAGEMTGGDVLTVLFSVLMGGLSLGQAAPLLQHFIGGKTAGARVRRVISRQPEVADAEDAAPLPQLQGAIALQGVHFAYPARPDVQIFSGLDLSVQPGQTVALVGESGSGKSSVVSLVMRYYDPLSGQVSLDGRDVRGLPLAWLRQQIGLVSQEPCLFQTSIYNNISYGCPDATREDVHAAARAANAHNFIMNLPHGYDTSAGETGGQLSGGQKQRVAIARAILKGPKILLLDEATSALDSTSERVVQKALEQLMPGRTTIVVAHRLSTVKSFHIAVMKQGQVVESGSHAELICRPGGAYATLVKLQQQRHAEADEEEVTEEDELAEVHGSRRSLEAQQKGASEKALRLEAAPEGGEAAPARTWRLRLPRGKKSKGSKDGRGDGEEAKSAKQADVPFSRLLALNKPELSWAVLGCTASAVLGAQMPAFAVALSSVIAVFYETNFDELADGAAMWSGIFVAIGVGTLFGSLVQQACFGLMGAKLSRRVRTLTFAALMRQELSWFDQEEHSSGAVSARLATDASAVRGAVGDQLGLLVQNLVTVVGGFVIAFVYGWKMTLVVLAVVPLMALGGWFQAQFMVGFSGEADKLFAHANQTASEAFSNIRTVAAFQMEESISSLYGKLLAPPTAASEKRAQVTGVGFGFSQGVVFLSYALAFWFGAREVDRGQMDFADVLKVFFAILLMALGVSQSQMAFPDVSKAKSAIQNVFALIDSRPRSIDVEAPGAEPSKVMGTIELRRVCFAYPSRQVPVFNDFSLTVHAGATVALVGPSGSGKSTVVSLVQRFYDPQSGQVLLDGTDIRTLQLKWLRKHIGVVSQEPVLFSASIEENIRFGRKTATLEEIRAAALSANAGFVDALPEGFATQVGQNGIQLSGGQKQRIAIARALIKNPRILLLDEATSALDAESEATVQVALEAAAQERTTLIVAHRLSTIRTANAIAVVQDGKILESGTHSELIAKPGSSYAALVRHQQQS